MHCKAAGCKRKVRAKGLCASHYHRAKHGNGDLLTPIMSAEQTDEERFLHFVYFEPNTGCWLWGGANNNGYGVFKKAGHSSAHRFSYENYKGPIPDGFQIDHLCRNPSCVNPDHLEPVTPMENTRRGNSGLWQKQKTHCPKGHKYTPKNTIWRKIGNSMCRRCRACVNERQRAYSLRKRKG